MFLTDVIANIGAVVQFYPCFKLSFCLALEFKTKENTVEPVYNGHPWDLIACEQNNKERQTDRTATGWPPNTGNKYSVCMSEKLGL